MLNGIVEKIIVNTRTQTEKAKAIFYFVRDKIKFDVYVDFPDVEEVLRRKAGACYHKSMVMVKMMKLIGIPARYHFILIKKEGLKDILHPLVYKFWPEEFLHTYPEIKLGDKWIMLDAAYDKEFHNKLIENRLNFGKDYSKLSLNIDFFPEGVKSAQCLYFVEDAGYGTNLIKLKRHVVELPIFKKSFIRLAGWLSRKQVKKIRNEGKKK